MAVGATAVFLDKDGTLVRDVPFNDDPDKVALMPGVGSGLRALAEAGHLLIMVTNQSGLARGLMTEEGFRASMVRLDELLAHEGVALDAVYVCPHYPGGVVPHLRRACGCRKPQPGMLLRAAAEHDIDLGRSWLIGDILDDVEAGNRAGCRTVMLSGAETEWLPGPFREPRAIVDDFTQATDVVLSAAAVTQRFEETPRRCAL